MSSQTNSLSNLGNRNSIGNNRFSASTPSSAPTSFGKTVLPSIDIKGKGAAFQSFLESNNLVARVAFLLLAL